MVVVVLLCMTGLWMSVARVAWYGLVWLTVVWCGFVWLGVTLCGWVWLVTGCFLCGCLY